MVRVRLLMGLLVGVVALVFASPVFAAGPPVVVGASVAGVTETSAVVKAQVNPEGFETWVYVEYGAGLTPVPVDIGSSEEVKSVTFSLVALAPGTTYHFHVVAFNMQGSVPGMEMKFATVSPVPVSAWWHVAAGARPSFVHAGAARDEVQEVMVDATGGRCLGEEEPGFAGCYAVKPDSASSAPAAVVHFNATAQELQAAFEEGPGEYDEGRVKVLAGPLYGKGDVQVTGGPLTAVTGNLSGPIAGRGSLSEGSATVEGFSVIEGTFTAGQAVEGEGVAAGTTVVEFDQATETLTLSKPVELQGRPSLENVVLTVPASGSNVVEDVAGVSGKALVVGQEILGGGFPAGTRIEKIEPNGDLVLTRAAVHDQTGALLSSALLAYQVTFTGRLGDQEVKPIVTNVNVASQAYITLPGGSSGTKCPGGSPCGSATVTSKEVGRPDAQLDVAVANVGDASAVGECIQVAAGKGRFTSGECSGEGEPGAGEFERSLEIVDRLPKGLRAVSVEAIGGVGEGVLTGTATCFLESLGGEGQQAVCQYEGALPAFDQIEMLVGVLVEPGAGSEGPERQQISVSGGGAPFFDVTRPVTISGEATPFGVEQYELTPEEEGGLIDKQAGSHPFQTTFTVAVNTGAVVPRSETRTGKTEVLPAGLTKDLSLDWPAGLIGNPTPFPVCSLSQFLTHGPGGLLNLCSNESVVGVVMVTFDEPALLAIQTETVPLFIVEPQQGEPARFGFLTPVGPVFIDPAIRNGEDYGITVHVDNITQNAGFLRAETTVWGVPDATAHDAQRGFGCLEAARGAGGFTCNTTGESNPPPFLSLPSSCPDSPLPSTITGDSWENALASPIGEPIAQLDGCNQLPFTPSLAFSPGVTAASSPSSLDVDPHVPQQESLNANGLAEGDVRDIKVTLPEGMVLNPAAGDGLQACSEAQIGYTGSKELDPFAEPGVKTPTFTPGEPSCPNASKIAKATITIPLLAHPLTGSVYLASPQNNPTEAEQNPFRSLIAMYIVAQDPADGVLAKLPGRIELNHSTGQITAYFEQTPQAPFENAEIEFFGGERAGLATPAHCNSYHATATYTPWSGQTPITVNSPAFNITTGPHGSPCPEQTLPFTPTLAGGMININAGAFSPLTTTISRQDGQQSIRSVSVQMPPGISGVLKNIPLCPEQQANEGSCPPESEIGETIVSVGVGNNPYTVTGGKVYLTEKYHGAPYGLSFVDPAIAGPFNLGKVIVRATINVDPTTAQLTVTTNNENEGYAIPHILDGIPLQIKHINVLINHPNFTFNPTNCSPKTITATITGTENTSQTTTIPLQATNCTNLKFAPKFSVSTSGKTSKANGASLSVKLSIPNAAWGTYTNIAKVKVDLPKQLPSRLTTLQKACLATVFETNPANCPPASIVGHAKVTTPLLPVPLQGPAYFVSHGNEAFPSLTIVLQGYGVTINLTGSTFIKKGITSSTFKTVPDLPFNTFELTLPQNKYSALTANTNLCKTKLNMPTAFTAQNGQETHQTTHITTTNCPKPHRRTNRKQKH